MYVAADAYRLQHAIVCDLNDVYILLMNITTGNVIRMIAILHSCLGHAMCMYIRSIQPRGIHPMRYTGYTLVISNAVESLINLMFPS